LVGGALLISGSVFGFKKCQQRRRGRRLINEEHDLERLNPTPPVPKIEITTSPSKSNDDVTIIQHVSNSVPVMPTADNNRLTSPLSNSSNERLPSAAMSITTMECVTPNAPQHITRPFPAVELIALE